jgi:50S ribosomal subunit-associated GTPase HflX
VFSKVDRLETLPSNEVMDKISSGYDYRFISKQDKGAVSELKEMLIGRVRADLRRTKVYVPYLASKAMEIVYRSCRIMETETKANGLLFNLEAAPYVIDQIERHRAEL